MGLFRKNKTIDNNVKQTPVELADELFALIQAASSYSTPSKEVQAILDMSNSRQDVLDYIIALASEEDTPRSRYLLAMGYSWSKAEYRPKAIEAIKNYLENEIDDEYKKWSHSELHGVPTTIERERDIHLSNMYHDLGKAYEGEYNFEKAYEAYKKASEYVPEYAHTWIGMAETYRKRNDLKKAIAIMEEFKKTKWYEPYIISSEFGTYFDDLNKRVTDNHIEEYTKKLESGYVYKPRGKNS